MLLLKLYEVTLKGTYRGDKKVNLPQVALAAAS